MIANPLPNNALVQLGGYGQIVIETVPHTGAVLSRVFWRFEPNFDGLCSLLRYERLYIYRDSVAA